MSSKRPFRNGAPLASQFRDGRMGILCRAEGAEINWGNTEATGSSSFLTRCVVVRTRSDRFYVVGESVVANLGRLIPDPEGPRFTGPAENELAKREYPEELPRLVIGKAWGAAQDLAADASPVGFTHIDWRKDRREFRSPSIVRFDFPNYFDPARQALSEFEPMATVASEPTPPPIRNQ